MIKIVKAEEYHISDIGELWSEFIRFHQDVDPIFIPHDNALAGFEEEQVQRLMKSEDGLVLVALDGEKVVGYSLSEIKDPPRGLKREKFGYIYDTAVTAGYRRNGIGKKMFDEIIKWFQLKSIDRVELDIATKNQVALSFWEKQGLTEYTRKLYKQI
jgi:ribosomal protein S18 acetylase RimI-like enzyme